LAECFRACIAWRGAFVRADRRDLDHARADRGGCESDCFGPGRLHRIECLPPALEQNADEIDHHIGLARSRLDGGGMAHIRLPGSNLSDAAQRLQEAGKLWAADGDANTVAELRQRAHHMTAEKA